MISLHLRLNAIPYTINKYSQYRIGTTSYYYHSSANNKIKQFLTQRKRSFLYKIKSKEPKFEP